MAESCKFSMAVYKFAQSTAFDNTILSMSIRCHIALKPCNHRNLELTRVLLFERYRIDQNRQLLRCQLAKSEWFLRHKGNKDG